MWFKWEKIQFQCVNRLSNFGLFFHSLAEIVEWINISMMNIEQIDAVWKLQKKKKKWSSLLSFQSDFLTMQYIVNDGFSFEHTFCVYRVPSQTRNYCANGHSVNENNWNFIQPIDPYYFWIVHCQQCIVVVVVGGKCVTECVIKWISYLQPSNNILLVINKETFFKKTEHWTNIEI